MDNQYKVKVIYNKSNNLLKVGVTETVKTSKNKFATKFIYTYFNNFSEKKKDDKDDSLVFDFQALDSNTLEFIVQDKTYINTTEKKDRACKLAVFKSIFIDEARERLLK